MARWCAVSLILQLLADLETRSTVMNNTATLKPRPVLFCHAWEIERLSSLIEHGWCWLWLVELVDLFCFGYLNFFLIKFLKRPLWFYSDMLCLVLMYFFFPLSGSVAVAWIFVNEKLNKNQQQKIYLYISFVIPQHELTTSSKPSNMSSFLCMGENSPFFHGCLVIQLWLIYARVTV